MVVKIEVPAVPAKPATVKYRCSDGRELENERSAYGHEACLARDRLYNTGYGNWTEADVTNAIQALQDFHVKYQGRAGYEPITDVWRRVRNERYRQEDLKAQGKFVYTCADQEITHSECLTVLTEELGEVAHEVNEAIGGRILHLDKLRTELIQVAAVAAAWVEKIDSEIDRIKAIG